MSTRITDDARILAALKHGMDVRDYYKPGYGWSNPPLSYRSIEDSAAPERYRLIGPRPIWRLKQVELIEIDSGRSTYGGACSGHDLRYRLTPAGADAAAAVDITLDRVFPKPKQRQSELPVT